MGDGTTVTVTFPVAAGVLPSASDQGTANSHEPSSSAVQVVLLVEDEETVRRSTRRLLERAGHTVVDVANGVDAIAVVEDGLDPTVLLTDLVLPGSFNGRDIANRVTQLSPGTRVVYASGYPSEVMSTEDLTRADARFLAKPFTNVALLDAIEGRDLDVVTR